MTDRKGKREREEGGGQGAPKRMFTGQTTMDAEGVVPSALGGFRGMCSEIHLSLFIFLKATTNGFSRL